MSAREQITSRTVQNLLEKGSKDGYLDKPARNWEVRGEDPNCDLGGHHHNPLLGHFYGTYEEVVALAVNLSGFFSWGGGGKILPYDHPEIVSARGADVKALAEEIKQAGIRRKALARLTAEEKRALGLED